MSEEVKTTTEVQQEEPNYLKEALEANRKLKADLEAKSAEMAKMERDNNELVKNILSGGEIKQEDNLKSPDYYRKVLWGPDKDNLNDIQVVENWLKLRESVMKETGEDIFVGKGPKYIPTPEEATQAQNVADCLKECIEYADGDNGLFVQETQRIMIDASPMQHRYKRR